MVKKSWLDFLAPKGEGASDEEATTQPVTQQSNASEDQESGKPVPLPEMNFDYSAAFATEQQPTAKVQPQAQAVVQEPAPGAATQTPGDTFATEPVVDKALEELVQMLNAEIRKNAAAGYRAFDSKRREITQVAPNTSIEVIMIAANVKPNDMLNELKVLNANLDAAVAEVEASQGGELRTQLEEIESQIQTELANAEEAKTQLSILDQEATEAKRLYEEALRGIRERQREAQQSQERSLTAVQTGRETKRVTSANLGVLSRRILLAKQRVVAGLRQEMSYFARKGNQ